ncbi:hypothetical protein LAG90_12735 [Marinilongibacter aquaticus]|uniref:hypothetical protein n=1 Tax=Marinilongibacter aquaticus TaxID=2975157 RepID=UPI0021BDB4B5|nr:hypothetical protein [Marinilongibacter aquaticus]UBM57679.1 hypothetical protein LAG90_12735 [Marinilongibacter aquaticus]
MKNLGKLSLLCFLFLMSCRADSFDMGEDLDLKTFKGDRMACEAGRESLVDALKKAQDKILSHSEDEILSTLGRYDFQLLDERKQKRFIYFLAAGKQCEGAAGESKAETMVIHFNALGLAKEVTFEQGLP